MAKKRNLEQELIDVFTAAIARRGYYLVKCECGMGAMVPNGERGKMPPCPRCGKVHEALGPKQ